MERVETRERMCLRAEGEEEAERVETKAERKVGRVAASRDCMRREWSSAVARAKVSRSESLARDAKIFCLRRRCDCDCDRDGAGAIAVWRN